MKKIINGRLYNTETAKEVGEYSYGGPRDFDGYSETLYQKKTGEFFLFGEGGPNSKYSRQLSYNEIAGDARILPLTWEEARDWAERHLDDDEYEAVFGEIAEDDSTQIVTISLPSDVVAQAKREAAQSGKTFSAYVADALTMQVKCK